MVVICALSLLKVELIWVVRVSGAELTDAGINGVSCRVIAISHEIDENLVEDCRAAEYCEEGEKPNEQEKLVGSETVA